MIKTAEHIRLEQDKRKELFWKRWGPYVSERSWGTVREDYSENGDAWGFLTHDMARSKAYRWGEDGLAGYCDRYQVITFSLALMRSLSVLMTHSHPALTICLTRIPLVSSSLARPLEPLLYVQIMSQIMSGSTVFRTQRRT
jgi:hypothetical protein